MASKFPYDPATDTTPNMSLARRSAVVALAIIPATFLTLPLVALLARAPWQRAGALLSSGAVVQSLRLTIICSLTATVLSVLGGLPLSWVLAKRNLPLLPVVRALIILPVVLPPVVGGVALLLAFGRNGVAGQFLDRWFGVRLPFTTAGAILAETFVAMPFFVLSMEGAFATADQRLSDVAATLGAPPLRTFTSVLFPSLRTPFFAAAVLAWARALGEFGATITFAGSFPGVSQTMPLSVYREFERDPEAAIMLSLVLVVLSLVVLVATGRRAFSPLKKSSTR